MCCKQAADIKAAGSEGAQAEETLSGHRVP